LGGGNDVIFNDVIITSGVDWISALGGKKYFALPHPKKFLAVPTPEHSK